MNKLIDEIQKLDYVNIPLFKKMIININDNIKRSLEKSNFNKASKLKYFKILLIKYIKEVKYINDDRYLKNILDKMKNLSVKIGEITNSEENDVLIDVHFPKFDDEYMNLLLIFIYKFSKINHKSLALLGTDYLKKLYYTIQNSSLDNTYSKVSLYDFIINNPNKKLDKFLKFIKENNYKEKLISYSIKLLHPLYLRNVIVNIKHIKNLKLFKNKSSNQKTKEAQEISYFFEKIMEKKYGKDNAKNHIANTRDTLCYATNENQTSIKQLIDLDIDLAFITGGYNSSNTSQLVKICENYFKTYFISSEKKLISKKEIIHFDMVDKIEKKHLNYLPNKKKINFLISGGASCPDSVLERLLEKICKYYNQPIDKKKIIKNFLKKY